MISKMIRIARSNNTKYLYRPIVTYSFSTHNLEAGTYSFSTNSEFRILTKLLLAKSFLA
jgi:hypothetical protein